MDPDPAKNLCSIRTWINNTALRPIFSKFLIYLTVLLLSVRGGKGWTGTNSIDIKNAVFFAYFCSLQLFRLFRGRRGAIVGKLSPSQLPVDISGDAGDRDTVHIQYFSVHSVHSVQDYLVLTNFQVFVSKSDLNVDQTIVTF